MSPDPARGLKYSFAPSVAIDDDRALVVVFYDVYAGSTWLGFATFVTVMCGSSLTLVTNVADVCRYTPTRSDMQIGLAASDIEVEVLHNGGIGEGLADSVDAEEGFRHRV